MVTGKSPAGKGLPLLEQDSHTDSSPPGSFLPGNSRLDKNPTRTLSLGQFLPRYPQHYSVAYTEINLLMKDFTMPYCHPSPQPIRIHSGYLRPRNRNLNFPPWKARSCFEATNIPKINLIELPNLKIKRRLSIFDDDADVQRLITNLANIIKFWGPPPCDHNLMLSNKDFTVLWLFVA